MMQLFDGKASESCKKEVAEVAAQKTDDCSYGGQKR